MYLTQGLHRSLQLRPQATASVFQGRRRTFAQLGERVARAGTALHHLGLQRGDRVGMLALNSDWYLEYYLAVLWAGGVVNPVNTRWSCAEIAYSLNDCETAILLVDDNFLALGSQVQASCPPLKTLVRVGDGPAPQGWANWEELIERSPAAPDALRGGEDLAGIFYTGGTTGQPKGVMLSHRGLYINAMASLAEGGLSSHDCIGLHAAPMFHLADGALIMDMIMSGATQVIVSHFDPVLVLKTFESEGITDTLLVPTMIQMLVDHPDLWRYDLTRLRNIIYGASPISEGVLERAMKALPTAGFTQFYGMTELSPCATVLPAVDHLGPGRAKGRHRGAGRAMVHCQVRICNEEDEEVPRGQVGQVLVRGPGMMQGYWHLPEQTQAALKGGWMHTGDGAYMDPDGYIYVVDRLKDMIVTGGENVYSAEVEQAISTHPHVATCAVIAVPDERWGEAVMAVIVPRAGCTLSAREIIDHCRERIAHYKCPSRVEFVQALPMSGAGKVLKTELRAPYWQGYKTRVS